MYLAEIHGKLSSKLSAAERAEDILTSNMFSFLKYATRTVFLKAFLDRLGIEVSDADLRRAHFEFWPTYDDKTEPDVVIEVGPYYLLFEAKLEAGFERATLERRSQVRREIEGGLLSAQTLGKDFWYVAITKDSVIPPGLPADVPPHLRRCSKWINWQAVSAILQESIEQEAGDRRDLLMAADLCTLLDRKRLRGFISFSRLDASSLTRVPQRLFFAAEEAVYRGSFIGFQEALSVVPSLGTVSQRLFYRKQFFLQLPRPNIKTAETVFFKKGVGRR